MLPGARRGSHRRPARFSRGAILTVLTTLAVATGALASWADKPRRQGKDVRVARVFDRHRGAVKFCSASIEEDQPGYCEGSPPEVGATALLFARTGQQVGVIQVESVEVSPQPCQRLSSFTYRIIDEQNRAAAYLSRITYAVFGVESKQANARLYFAREEPREMPAVPRGEPVMAVDLDRDDELDMVMSMSECTDEKLPPWAARLQVTAECLHYWLRQGERWRPVGRDIAYTCT